MVIFHSYVKLPDGNSHDNSNMLAALLAPCLIQLPHFFGTPRTKQLDGGLLRPLGASHRSRPPAVGRRPEFGAGELHRLSLLDLELTRFTN